MILIYEIILNNNGTLATYRLVDTKAGTGEAKGREALSESAGLWLQYTLDKDDQALFAEQKLCRTNDVECTCTKTRIKESFPRINVKNRSIWIH